MLGSTQAIVLSKIKYRDNDLIVKCYTLNRGVVSYLLPGVLKSKKGTSKAAYFQALSQLLIEEDYRKNKSLHYIKDVKINNVYQSLHSHVIKSAVTMFVAEILSLALKEEENNQTLYSFLETALLWFDSEKEYANFHLLFLVKLTKYLGFYPELPKQNDKPFFNLETGTFESIEVGNYSISGKNVDVLKHLLVATFDTVSTIKLKSEQRQSFLNMLLLYYELHIGGFKKTKSLDIFGQVFS
ncbi:DNA repair protein RecO [Corallibacter sp.]|uniref:DNA repair protein RecO n=1 Tax=Corallibacter sp. TaxID=2038084 RepID=UPI003AB3960B